MRRTREEQLAAWADETLRQGTERRNWPVVQKLAAACVALMIAGLLAELWLASAGLAVLSYIGAGVFGGAMLTYFYDDRLFVERPPTP